jgi:hypothetical protein
MIWLLVFLYSIEVTGEIFSPMAGAAKGQHSKTAPSPTRATREINFPPAGVLHHVHRLGPRQIIRAKFEKWTSSLCAEARRKRSPHRVGPIRAA